MIFVCVSRHYLSPAHWRHETIIIKNLSVLVEIRSKHDIPFNNNEIVITKGLSVTKM